MGPRDAPVGGTPTCRVKELLFEIREVGASDPETSPSPTTPSRPGDSTVATTRPSASGVPSSVTSSRSSSSNTSLSLTERSSVTTRPRRSNSTTNTLSVPVAVPRTGTTPSSVATCPAMSLKTVASNAGPDSVVVCWRGAGRCGADETRTGGSVSDPPAGSPTGYVSAVADSETATRSASPTASTDRARRRFESPIPSPLSTRADKKVRGGG
ncbi:hypothetical protein [Halorussus caseinilyticus]|uniref:Uncharacterized protein n=1 Tax=Halorussus caseinilyticus TaxID=3034025 RepID=A0ABD5WJ68_9EURY